MNQLNNARKAEYQSKRALDDANRALRDAAARHATEVNEMTLQLQQVRDVANCGHRRLITASSSTHGSR